MRGHSLAHLPSTLGAIPATPPPWIPHSICIAQSPEKIHTSLLPCTDLGDHEFEQGFVRRILLVSLTYRPVGVGFTCALLLILLFSLLSSHLPRLARTHRSWCQSCVWLLRTTCATSFFLGLSEIGSLPSSSRLKIPSAEQPKVFKHL